MNTDQKLFSMEYMLDLFQAYLHIMVCAIVIHKASCDLEAERDKESEPARAHLCAQEKICVTVCALLHKGRAELGRSYKTYIRLNHRRKEDAANGVTTATILRSPYTVCVKVTE